MRSYEITLIGHAQDDLYQGVEKTANYLLFANERELAVSQ
jgi:hypothetical protein